MSAAKSEPDSEQDHPPGYRSLPNPLPSNLRYRAVLWQERLNWLLLTVLILFSPIVLSLVIAGAQNVPLPFSMPSLPALALPW
ncbi:hypothetical protein [Kushneria aurantia]|uniref:Uncharacterized protein n=1 Tax=Kushneria aurantia TaxID=504092 RepID=A0ABV6G6W5_9GAMM|nr:hypothetical protein [Kushneria aurantia]